MNLELPKSYLGGHVGTYSLLNRETSPEEFEGGLFDENPVDKGMIKFTGFSVLPFTAFVSNNATDSGNGTFTVFGPIYSLLYETCKMINYSIQGDYVTDDSGADIWARAIDYAPHIVIIPIPPTLDTMVTVMDLGIVTFTNRHVGIDEMDHILSKREYSLPSLTAMFSAFGLPIWLGILITLAFYSFKAVVINKLKVDWLRYPKLRFVLLYLITCFFYAPDFGRCLSRLWRLDCSFWTIYTMFLKLLIGDQMVTVLTLGAELKSINTYEQLATEYSDLPITTFAGNAYDNIEPVRLKYLSKHLKHRDVLTKRLVLLEMEKMTDNKVVSDILKDVAAGNRVHLGFESTLQYYINHWFNGSYSDSVYISKEYGHTMPGFMMITNIAPISFKKGINFIMGQLDQSGIYIRWVNYHVGESKIVKSPELENSATNLGDLRATFIFLYLGLFASFVMFLVEAFKKKSPKQTEKTKLFHRIHQWKARSNSI